MVCRKCHASPVSPPPSRPKDLTGAIVLWLMKDVPVQQHRQPLDHTTPGDMQPPIRLQPLPSNPAIGTVPKITSGSRLLRGPKATLLENEAPFLIGGKKAVMKFRNSMDNSQGMNRYQLLNNYIPIPPSPPPRHGKKSHGKIDLKHGEGEDFVQSLLQMA